jgi:hypothetical protein
LLDFEELLSAIRNRVRPTVEADIQLYPDPSCGACNLQWKQTTTGRKKHPSTHTQLADLLQLLTAEAIYPVKETNNLY